MYQRAAWSTAKGGKQGAFLPPFWPVCSSEISLSVILNGFCRVTHGRVCEILFATDESFGCRQLRRSSALDSFPLENRTKVKAFPIITPINVSFGGIRWEKQVFFILQQKKKVFVQQPFCMFKHIFKWILGFFFFLLSKNGTKNEIQYIGIRYLFVFCQFVKEFQSWFLLMCWYL